MFDTLKTFLHQGRQFIPDPSSSKLPVVFPGRPVISSNLCAENCSICHDICPVQAITLRPVTLNTGSCIFCRECEASCPEKKITFSNDFRMASNCSENLAIHQDSQVESLIDPNLVRKEVIRVIGRSLKLRLVSAGSCNGCEWELNASGNVNFDIGRWGIEFVASPRHADGLVVTGAIVENSLEAIRITYEAIPSPKIFVLAGACAIQGGLFKHSPAVKREFLNTYKPDLYLPGCPPHPLSIINGFLSLIEAGKK